MSSKIVQFALRKRAKRASQTIPEPYTNCRRKFDVSFLTAVLCVSIFAGYSADVMGREINPSEKAE